VTRVLQVVLSLAPGGTEHLVIELCRRLGQNFDVAVCCLEDEGAWAAGLRQSGIDVVALERPQGFRPHVGRQIAQLAADRGATLLHCHQYSPFVYGRIAKLWKPGLKLVYTEHGRLSDAPPPWKRRMVNPVLAQGGGAIVAVSHDLREYMLAARFPRAGVRVIHNGINVGPSPSMADRRHARHLLGIDPDTFVVATVARLDPVKDLQTLLEAFAKVRQEVPRSRLLVIGEGPERAALADRAMRPDLAGSVEFAGLRSDVRDLLPAADVYANSSISEGVSVTILEAMAAGIPVVATAAGGTPEVLTDGEVGVLVPRRDAARLSDAIVALSRDRSTRLAIGVAGRRRLESSFTIERMVSDYQHLYQQVLGSA
jgi:glycosyltransferase involved in cell wall biosynthesis